MGLTRMKLSDRPGPGLGSEPLRAPEKICVACPRELSSVQSSRATRTGPPNSPLRPLRVSTWRIDNFGDSVLSVMAHPLKIS